MIITNSYREGELNSIFNIIRKYKPLNNQQIAELQAKGDYETILKHNMRFAVSIAHCYPCGGAISVSDLVTEASMGILEAAKLFDTSLNYTFTTFAVHYIRKHIKRFLVANQRTIHIADHASRESSFYNTISMDSPTTEDEHCTVVDTFSGDLHADRLTEHTDRQAIIEILCNQLDKRQRYILLSLYGIGGKEKSLYELASELNLTEERIRQLKCEALEKLKGLI